MAREKERERRGDIREGNHEINDAFSVFTPGYFKGFNKDYLGYYNPQINDKFDDARQGLKYNLARAGIQDSTAGQNKFGDLVEAYGDQKRALASNALEATNKIRTQVEQNKSDLFSQNQAAADPSLAAMQAAGRAGSLQTPPSFSPIGDIFNGLANVGTSYLNGRNQALPPGYAQQFAPGYQSASGSGRVVS